MRLPNSRRIVAAAGMALLVSASAAAAHPGVTPNEATTGTPVAITMTVPHGCGPDGGHGAGEDQPTNAVLIDLADIAVAIEPAVNDGWRPVIEEVAGEPTALEFAASDGPVAAPFELSWTMTPVAPVEDGLRVLQVCGDQTIRWGGGDPSTPIVRFAVTGDPIPQPSVTAAASDTSEDLSSSPADEPATDDDDDAQNVQPYEDAPEDSILDQYSRTIGIAAVVVPLFTIIGLVQLRRRREGKA